MIVLIRPWPNILLLQGKYVLTEMKKLTVSNNPTWSMEEKHLDLARREKRDRNRVSLGKKLLDRLVALEHYPINSTEDFKNLMTRVQDAGDGTYLSMHTKITYHYSFLTRRPPTRNVRNMDQETFSTT